MGKTSTGGRPHHALGQPGQPGQPGRPDQPAPALGRPGHRWARPALAGFGVAGLALAALALRAAPGRPAWHAGGVLGERAGLTTLLALALAGGGAALITHLRAVRKAEPEQGPLAERLVSAVGVLLILLTVTVPLTLLLLPGRIVNPQRLQSGLEPQPLLSLPPTTAPPQTLTAPAAQTPATEHHSVGSLLGYLTLTLLSAAALCAAVLLWRRYGHLLRRGGAAALVTLSFPEDEPGQALAEAVDSGLRALHGTDVRAAVIACYAAMEHSLAESGLPGRASDSPSDLLARAAADGLLTGEPPQRLAELFREARYSSHPMAAHHLDAARAGLDAIAAQLATTSVASR
ncbi:DUF4129 domain-containing protein [Kitasatospora sp. NPDC002227]|uniref:DUF4129 domain-containing protein n=1 Tax=Kitasatospora sp. NPDC002227 TaxID=3154773 RepID=UPI0033303DB5